MIRPSYRPNFRELLDPTLLVVLVIILIVGIILSMLFADKVSGFKKEYRNKYWVYLISGLLIFALLPFMGSTRTITELLDEFIFYQITIFILGTFHAIIYRLYFNKFKKEGYPWMEFLFNILIGLFCTIPFMIVYTYINGITYTFPMVASFIFFLVPTWIYASYIASVSIPAKFYTTWEFPEEGSYSEPKDDEYRDMVVVTFVFHKNPNSEVRTEFRAKSPIRMDFGRLFYHFVYDYNNRNPDSTIQLVDEEGNLQHWVFYLKPNWYSQSKYIDPKYPLYMNGVEENSVVYCLRTKPQKDPNDWEDEKGVEKENNDEYNNKTVES